MNTFYVAWQDPETRKWFPIGRLQAEISPDNPVEMFYQFVYTKGAREAEREVSFRPLEAFPSFEDVYESNELFPLFTNRILSKSRPEYGEYLTWLNAPAGEVDPLALLSVSGGGRATDSLEVFPLPQQSNDGKYRVRFFVHGIRHMTSSAQEKLRDLEAGMKLLLAHDLQNPRDPQALMLRFPTDPPEILGYCPRYLTEDFFRLLQEGPEKVLVTVEKVNPPPAPSQLRVLCAATAEWPDNFVPLGGEAYQPAVEEADLMVGVGGTSR